MNAFIAMSRFLAIFISGLVLVSAASAQTWQRSVVELFRDVCVLPATPTAMMAAGEKIAAARDWKPYQVKSGLAPFTMHGPPEAPASDPNEQPSFVVKAWTFSLPAVPDIRAVVSIAGPEYPDVRYSMCGFMTPGSVVEEVVLEVQRLFGSLVITSSSTTPTPNVSHYWLLSQDGKTVENCGKVISVSSYHPKTHTILSFAEMHFPDKYGTISQTNFC